MRVAVVAEYYPRPRDPALGIWAHRQAVATRDAGADVRVLALDRPVPPRGGKGERKGNVPFRSRAGKGTFPSVAELDRLQVEYVRFLAPPRRGTYAWWDAWARRPLERALSRAGPFDLVHAHYALPAGGAARGWARRNGVPLVVSVHGGDVLGPELQRPAARARVAAVLRDAAVVLCNSRATLARCAALAGDDGNMRVVHLGADAPAAPPPPRAEPTVATLGHAIARKRHADVLRAVALARRDVPDLRWVAIGDGPELPAIRALASELGLDGAVELPGALAPDAALAELARCHVMALPSVDEAFGVAYVEALACGVPAIGCRGEGGPDEIAAAGGGMLLVPPGDVEALAAAIRDALGRHSELSDAARATAREHFTWDACGRATVAAYRDALS